MEETDDAGGSSVKDPAVLALARVRAAAKAARGSGGPIAARPGGRRSVDGPRSVGGFSGHGEDERDPRRLGAAMLAWADNGGYRAQLTVAGLTGRWAEIVGDHVASHVTADNYERLPHGGRLTLTADSPLWESTMKYQTEEIKARIADELGSGLVTEVVVRGPGRARRGGWRVQYGRRDRR